jgi:uncharacterized protein involved in exopolysaccharide biosynthesis
VNTPTQPTPDDEISLLDILVVLAENFWLLVLAPLAIGAITFGIVSFLPKTYESVAILRPKATLDAQGNSIGETPAVMAARLGSPEVQLAAVDTQPWIRKQQLDRVQIADFLERSIGVRVDRQTDIITLSAKAPSPSEAQSLNQAILETLLAKVPSVQGTKMTMQDIVIQAPTLNDKAIKPKRLQLTAISSILSGLVLAVFVFIRAALRGASRDPESADKVARIRKGILRQ